jgi:hypothetical protein
VSHRFLASTKGNYRPDLGLDAGRLPVAFFGSRTIIVVLHLVISLSVCNENFCRRIRIVDILLLRAKEICYLNTFFLHIFGVVRNNCVGRCKSFPNVDMLEDEGESDRCFVCTRLDLVTCE